jgi:gentisate 1,2-dioxygenase
MKDDIADGLLNAVDLDAYYRKLVPAGMGPGWNKTEPSMYPVPKKEFVPAHWRYVHARAALDGAARLVGTEHAERRNLIMNNPVPGNTYATARTIVGAYQMIKGHEVARSHRHTSNAMRFILEAGPKAYTVVEGQKVPMVPGDVLLTPNWCWHGHSNDGPDNAYWIDFLDAPLTHVLGPMFFEQYHDEFVQQASGVAENSPFRFPFAVWGPKAASAPEVAPGMREILIGPPLLDTLRLKWRHFDNGATVDEVQTTANCCYAVLQGTGRVECDGSAFDWARGDVFVIPSWRKAKWSVNEESFLFRVSDETLLEKINWLHSAAPGARMENAENWGKGSF